MSVKEKVVSMRDVEVKFMVRNRELTAIRGVDLDIYKGEILAIVGESGSGKSVLTKTLTGMLEANGRVSGGEIFYYDKEFEQVREESNENGQMVSQNYKNLAKIKSNEDWLDVRGKKIATIFQDPMTSLNPLLSIGFQISEVLIKHRDMTKEEAKEEAISLLKKVGISDAEDRYNNYPFQYSGGMRQRVVIAVALACKPDVLICDEPTTALDVTIQAQILDLLKELAEENKFTVVFITHDLGVVANVADRVAVMYAGQIVEYGTSDEVFYDPQHPYTWALLSSLPQLGKKGEELYAIVGTPPSLFHKIDGDAFAVRNPYALKIDFVEEPPMFKVSETHYAKTWLLDKRAPKVKRPRVIEDLSQRVEELRGDKNV